MELLKEIKYLGKVVDENGNLMSEINARVKAAFGKFNNLMKSIHW